MVSYICVIFRKPEINTDPTCIQYLYEPHTLKEGLVLVTLQLALFIGVMMLNYCICFITEKVQQHMRPLDWNCRGMLQHRGLCWIMVLWNLQLLVRPLLFIFKNQNS